MKPLTDAVLLTVTVTAGLLFLCGCGGADRSTVQQAGDGAPEVTIGVSVPAADHGWTAGVGWWAERAMDMYPEINWVYATALNPEKQTSDVEDMMAQGVDGLVILATESAPLTPVAKRAHERGIYIVNVDRGFLEPVADLFLEGDNAAFGRKAAEYMADKLGGKGRIVILRGIPSTVDTARFEAGMKVFEKHADIEVLGVQPGMWNRQKALEVMQAFLAQHDDIDAVWAADDDMALGCEQAIREAGRAGDIWVFGGGGMKDIVKKIMDKDPMFPATVTYPPSMIATGIHMAVSSLRDGQSEQVSQFLPRHLVLDVELIEPENAARYYFPESVY